MSTLATCNDCRKEFEKGLDNCPNCGKDQRSFLDKYKIPIFVSVILIFGMVMGATGG